MMPPFRLLHVAGLDWDAALPRRPEYSAPLAELCRQAPLALAERIVEAAIAHDVNGVLLTPASSSDSRPDVLNLASLESWQEVFDSLNEQGIAVIIAASNNGPLTPGLTKHDRQQQQDAHVLPDGVSVLRPEDHLPLYDRQGRPCVEFRGRQAITKPLGKSPMRRFVIGLGMGMANLPKRGAEGCDYLALGSGPRLTRHVGGVIAHCPGPPQGRSPRETGPHGISLLTFDDDGRLDVAFIPTASVRFETLAVSADAGAELDDLALQAMETLSEQEVETSEQAWLVSWAIQASRHMREILNTPGGRSEFLSLLPEEHEGRLVFHQVANESECDGQEESPFTGVFQAALKEKQELLDSRDGRASLVGVSLQTPEGRRIADLLPVCDVREVMDQARQYGHRLAEVAARDPEFGNRESRIVNRR